MVAPINWLDFRLDHFSLFIFAAITGFTVLATLYSLVFMKGKENVWQFYSYVLLTFILASGAVLANNLILFLFFWEGLLLTLFGLIFIGRKEAYKTAIKAVVIVGISDLCLLFGIVLTAYLAGTFTLSNISLPLTTLSSIAFIFMIIGALAKAGSMPLHSWIPDAALDAPLPFMALLPAALDKLLGIYFLARITLEMFQLQPGHWLSVLLMTIGALTIVLAVMMALVQKDFKRLLAYHAISQAGYMILGIGTAVPVGIVGGLFHMINNALYKSCLFLAGGSVEKQAGTTDLAKLSGLGKKMPITFACFVIAAASISGVPPFNGFFSKELIYDGALASGWIFYAAAVLGSFFTAASFLKLGHAAFLPLDGARGKGEEIKEAPWPMLLPMIIIASLCILLGVNNALPLNNLIQPILGAKLEGHSFAGWPHSAFLVIMTLIVLVLAWFNHRYGVAKSGKVLGASDHIHHAPVLSGLYDKAEKRYFDPYDLGMSFTNLLAKILFWFDRAIDWVHEVFTVKLVQALTGTLRWAQSGNFSTYVIWALLGVVIVAYLGLR